MKKQTRLLTMMALASGLALTGCKTMESGNVGSLMDTGSTAMKAMSLSDADIVTLSNESCEAMDAQSKIAPASSKYSQRLNKVVSSMPGTINGKKAVYKVYLTEDVNAWAMANGCIRVYSGLMDLMNDDELRGVIGHEIGHVALGHSKSRMQTAYAASAVRSLAANSGNGALASLSRSQAGELGEKFLNAQFSQSQESNADDYSFDLLTEKKMKREGLVTGFQKLSKLSGGSGGNSMMSSHPPSDARAKRMQDRIDGKK
ncbi:M48 family metallopeptidase [Diaphorobacter aerolatus]|uniref:M48 family metallopeptidase n=1 Tax=Diaphorobacter aerolatus TaxID=1288495 RepID=A0A7H0GFP2_9BURK|nr:M48 family metallopeptidase [Diaphorobacter aerolatus]QNP47108.1 M48 family metallopeptidase [Diaphorobacter aerolatus]